MSSITLDDRLEGSTQQKANTATCIPEWLIIKLFKRP